MPTEDGLSSHEAAKLLAQFGKNILPEKSPPSSLKIFFQQLKSPLVSILLIAGVITILLQEYSDSVIIFAAVLINTILGFVQEKRANDALHALKKMVEQTASVFRDGKPMVIAVEELVPGDTVILNQGDRVPADGDLIHANRLFFQEAMLTGESTNVSKKTGDKIFMGTIVTGGRGFFKVTTTGEETEIGKIAEEVQQIEEETPIKRQLRIFSQKLSIFILILTVVVFIIGLLGGQEIKVIFTTSVALAVSAIPEGLLIGLTVVLAIGMQRILKKRGLVRNLVSAETLGGVTTICADKTGTLTEGKMQVVEFHGKTQDLVLQSLVANDMDDPMELAAYDWAEQKTETDIVKTKALYKRLDSLPFSSEERFFASLNSSGEKKNTIFVNGAPEFLLEWSDLTKKQKEEIKKQIHTLTSKGMRLVGMAKKEVHFSHKKLTKSQVKSGLTWVGILALSDPVRSGVKDALAVTHKAGINVLVITGDYAQTAQAVMKQVGLSVPDSKIVLGEELRKMSAAQLAAKLRNKEVLLFARTTPDQKLKIVEALQQNGEVVAMMGDGVNDAPALARADIGIVVGDATDVAKESADLILLDSSFNTIISAIEEGRGIFDNLRKIVLYLMSDAFSAIVVVVASIVAGLPLVLTATQILWINLVSDSLPNLALTLDPKRKNIMSFAPRSPQEPLITKKMNVFVATICILSGLVSFGFFVWFYQSGNLELARSVAFASLGINTLVYIFLITNPFRNLWLIGAVFAGLLIFLSPFVYAPLGAYLQVIPLSLQLWSVVLLAAGIMFFAIELAKGVYHIMEIDRG